MSEHKIPSPEEIENFLMGLPGKRGYDIPEQTYDRIFGAANGVTQQIWGRHPEPEQIQWLFDNGHHQPDQVTQVFGSQPHPHAPSVTVAEYEQFAAAKDLFDNLQGGHHGGG